MTITTTNYQKIAATLDWKKMPDTLRKGHELAKEIADNDWEDYKEDEDIKGVINTYFTKLGQYLETEPAKTAKVTTAKKSPTKKPAAQQSHKPKQQTAKKKPASAKEKKQDHAKHVEHIESDLRFIQRFVAMHGKKKSRSQLLGLLQGLQKAIVERRIKKESPYATEIRKMEKNLKDCLEVMGDSIEIEIPADNLEHYREIAASEKVARSVQLLKAYIALSGKTHVKEKIEKLYKRIGEALDSGQVKASDRYHRALQDALANLTTHLKANKPSLHISQYELNGLSGVGSSRRHIPAWPLSKKKDQPEAGSIDRYDVLEVRLQAKAKSHHCGAELGSVEEQVSGPAKTIPLKADVPVYSGAQIANMRFESIGLTGRFRDLIGDPAPGFKAMIYGKPKQGKSTLAIMFAKELARLGKVKYCALEEGFSMSLKDKVVRIGGNIPNLYFSEDIGDVNGFRFVFIDSVSEGKFDADQLKALTKQYPKICFIFVFHATKGGNFRGGQQYAHDVDVIIRVEEGVAYAQGRFAPPAEMPLKNVA